MSAKIRLCVALFVVTQVGPGGVRQGSDRPGVCGELPHRHVRPGATSSLVYGRSALVSLESGSRPGFPLPSDPGCLHLSLAAVLSLSSACLSRWFEALWLLPQSQMDSFREGQGTNEDEKISLCCRLVCERKCERGGGGGGGGGEPERTGVCERQRGK